MEDDEDLRKLTHFNLFTENYNVLIAKDGQEGLELATTKRPDLILLDIMLPIIDGLEVCARLKSQKNTKHIPIIMLSALGEEEQIAKGLDLGADDYITKPYSPKILIARIKAVLRRTQDTQIESGDIIKRNGIVINKSKRSCNIDDHETNLTFSEFELLKLLLSFPGRVFSRMQIVNALKGDNVSITDRAVDVQVVGLRKKLGSKSEIIETVRGVGYRLQDN